MVALDVLDDEEDNEHTQLKAKLGSARSLNVSTGLLLLAQECLLDSPRGAKSARMLLDAGLRACSGQDADLATIGPPPGGLDGALAITARKSASLTAVVCRLGALSAGADEATQELYARFGWLLGMGAQLSNDLAALHTDVTGKTDITLRRPTLPLSYAALQGSIGDKSSEADARAALWAGGAVHLTWVIAEAYRRHALRLILQLTDDPGRRDELAGLIPAPS
jgi:heptaprenyl diphosphate synthase